MRNIIAHRRVEARFFMKGYQEVFTTRSDGRRWSRWQDTWCIANCYLFGLLSPGRKKSMQRISYRVNTKEDRIEQFIRESPWEYAELQKHLVFNVPIYIRSKKSAIIVDDVGFKKQGTHSSGVQRQYCGALGKIGNCQVGVDLVYTTPGERRNADQKTWPLGMELYLPESWIDDWERREEVGIPEDVTFRTKPQIALEMIARVREANLEHACIVSDAGYGESDDFRETLRKWKEAYILGTQVSKFHVIPESTELIPLEALSGKEKDRGHHTYPKNVCAETPIQIAKRVENWAHITWSKGTKRQLSGDFYRERVRVVEDTRSRETTDEIGWLLLEKRKDEKGKEELKAYICWGMDNATIGSLIKFVHLRWTVEQFHREDKQLLGLDRFEGRSWKGWHHHVSIVLLAYAFLSDLRARMGTDEELPTIPSAVKIVVHEMATQCLIKEHNLPRTKAKRIAETMLRGYSDW